jgi:predicted ArsR family transcriptional regulator
MDRDRAGQLTAVAALAEPTRRRLYEHVVRQPAPVSRDEAAAALDLPRATVAFHLDRLVDEGLLAVGYERRTGRTGPGAGRPAKLYRRAGCSMSVSLPERRYDLAGQLLADALVAAEGSGEPPSAALDRLAHLRGRSMASEVRTEQPGADPRAAALRVLEEHGFEPRAEDDGVVLANCPFHTLVQQHTSLVCGMNLRLLEGLLDGLPGSGLVARLEPVPGACCVRLGAPPAVGSTAAARNR